MKIQEYESQLSKLTERIEPIASDIQIDNIVRESKAVLKQIEEKYCAQYHSSVKRFDAQPVETLNIFEAFESSILEILNMGKIAGPL
jgi:hypothetical protein